MFALGIIGFMIGGELRGDVFKKYGRQFFVILFSQGISAFVLVAAVTSAAGWLITKDAFSSIAVGLVLGAIASATAPAATGNVLWQYKTRGPLTAAILAIATNAKLLPTILGQQRSMVAAGLCRIALKTVLLEHLCRQVFRIEDHSRAQLECLWRVQLKVERI